jgi:hypothetical protein
MDGRVTPTIVSPGIQAEGLPIFASQTGAWMCQMIEEINLVDHRTGRALCGFSRADRTPRLKFRWQNRKNSDCEEIGHRISGLT